MIIKIYDFLSKRIWTIIGMICLAFCGLNIMTAAAIYFNICPVFIGWYYGADVSIMFSQSIGGVILPTSFYGSVYRALAYALLFCVFLTNTKINLLVTLQSFVLLIMACIYESHGDMYGRIIMFTGIMLILIFIILDSILLYLFNKSSKATEMMTLTEAIIGITFIIAFVTMTSIWIYFIGVA